MNKALTICLKNGQLDVYDGRHSMIDLYDHRCILFIKLMRAYPGKSWRAREHHERDCVCCPKDFFLACINTPEGQVSYHLPLSMWGKLDGIKTFDQAPKWDGHGSADSFRRLEAWDNGPELLD